jgi:hypothetical protein
MTLLSETFLNLVDLLYERYSFNPAHRATNALPSL